jgi:membrane fusion protein, copper/silver efflux system
MTVRERKGGTSAVKILLSVLLISVFLLGYFMGGGGKESPQPVGTVQSPSPEEKKPEQSVIWTCSMHPQIRLPNPGKCPICFMDLIPLTKDTQTGESDVVSLRQITMSPLSVKLAEVSVEPVKRRSLGVDTRMVGKVDYDETRLGYITTYMGGRIDKLYVDYTGSVVTKGQAVASIYSPELLTAQAELIQAVQSGRELEKSGLTRVRDAAMQTANAAKEKLRLLGLTNDQIEAFIKSGVPSDHITLHAPMSGIVIKKEVLEGMYVQTGTKIYTIADLSHVWVVLEAYESDLHWIKLGQHVEFQAEAFAGEVFRGTTVYIDPLVNEQTRTVRIRLDVPNPAGKLKPGMFVRAIEKGRSGTEKESLAIPASAPLITGKRAIVYVQLPGKEGTYEGREIILGPRAGDFYMVRSGLSEGDLVVTKGNFKIDSAVQLQAKPSMMSPQGAQASLEQQNGKGAPEIRGSGEAPSASPIPGAFASQLPRLAGAFETVKTTLQIKDLNRTREAYKAFYNVLCAVDPTSLTDLSSALLWKEASMLLRNDTMLGSESDTNEEAMRLFATLAEHFQLLKGHFQLDHILQVQAVSASVPVEFKGEMGKLLRHYLAIQTSLANDDFAGAKKAGEKFATALKGTGVSPLKGEARKIWAQSLDNLSAGTDRVLGAQNIEALRQGFERLSTGMAGAIERLGVDIKGPVFELFCPMAFDNKGATWLQQDQDIRNPYFGAEMLKCGEVRRPLKGERS